MVSVLVPYRLDFGWRDRAWAFNRPRWEALGVEVVVESPADGENPGDFNHPYAINRAAEKATGDIFIVADVDTAFEPEWVSEAVDAVVDGRARWVLPRYYDQIDRASTEAIYEAENIVPYEVGWRGDSVCWSGLVVIPRQAFELVGGYDERWEFWGGDDVAFACSMNTLWGQVTRLEGAAMHLWHPRTHLDAQPREQDVLMRRYMEAAGDPERIRAVQAR